MRPPIWTSRTAAVVVPARRDGMLEERIDDEVIFSDPRTGSVFHLNGSALDIWRRCDGRATTRAIARALTTQWDVDLDTALDDVEQVVTLLAESGLLQTGGTGGMRC